MLQNKKILLIITGSIAAYKTATLVRLLIKQNTLVKVVMSESATAFITPLTLATLSKNPVLVDFVDDKNGTWNNHVELGLWADAIVVAPATAGTLAKCANGICDNLPIAVYLSAKCPVFFAPAMDLDMYKHQSTLENLRKLISFGNQIIPSESGELASGLVGEGRMAEPENIIIFLENFFKNNQQNNLENNQQNNLKNQQNLTQNLTQNLKGKSVLITAGPTFEALDPVRFIGNYSTGKMGYAIAESLAQRGAQVRLISGPTSVQLIDNQINKGNIEIFKVQSAQEMYEKANQFFLESDIIILAAAVADYRPKTIETQKIKKKTDEFVLEMVKTIDIAATLGKIKQKNQLMVGFALETNDEKANASKKLISKNLDFIVLNSLNDAGAGFGHDTNKITILDKNGVETNFELKSKKEVAEDIANQIEKMML